MPRLTPCPSCRVHVLVDDRECPHCGATLRTAGASRVAVVAMGLTLAGCPAETAPLYGATDSFDDTLDSAETSPPDTSTTSTPGTSTTGISGTTTGETDAMTGTTADSSTGMADSTSGGTGDTDATTGSTSVGEPDYGVPESSS